MKILRYFPMFLLLVSDALAVQSSTSHTKEVARSHRTESLKDEKRRAKAHNVGYAQQDLRVPITNSNLDANIKVKLKPIAVNLPVVTDINVIGNFILH